MKRILLLLVVVAMLLAATRVEAGHFHWGHHHWGHHHHWHGHRWAGYGGWGGYGWGYRPYNGISVNVGWGGYRPFYGGYYGYYPATYYRPVYGSFGYPYYLGWSAYFSGYGVSDYYYRPVYYAPTYSYPLYDCYLDNRPAVRINNLIVVRDRAIAPRVVDDVPRVVVDKPVGKTRVDDLAEARRYVKLGDTAFREGRYLDALTRYRSAAEITPKDSQIHFRKGYAYLAKGQYALAASSFRNGLRLEGKAGAFRLDDLYGDDSVAKGVHIENLAAEALMKEESADAYFLLAMMLRADGEAARAEKFFRKAADLSPETRELIADLLPAERETPVSMVAGDEI